MKKMRKLVPAFAMLMVAAIMMSTASFAWFTMNDRVTASGMQIQAKATGSLIIDTKPLTFAAVKTDATIDSGNHSLRPVTWVPGTGNTAGAWMDAGEASVNYNTGVVSGDLATANMVSGENYFDQEIYIGSAGDTLTNQTLTITLTAPNAPTEATYAYSVAIYNMGTTGWTANTGAGATAAPAEVVSVCAKSANTNVATISGLTIPSIVGVGAQDDATVGLKLVLRFFVDGALQAKNQGDGSALTKPVFTNYAYQAVAADATFNENTTYYISDGNGGYEAVINPIAANLSTYFVRVPQYTQMQYNYINSAQVPTLGSTLDLSFSAQ